MDSHVGFHGEPRDVNCAFSESWAGVKGEEEEEEDDGDIVACRCSDKGEMEFGFGCGWRIVQGGGYFGIWRDGSRFARRKPDRKSDEVDMAGVCRS